MRVSMNRLCVECGDPFTSSWATVNYCSDFCRQGDCPDCEHPWLEHARDKTFPECFATTGCPCQRYRVQDIQFAGIIEGEQ